MRTRPLTAAVVAAGTVVALVSTVGNGSSEPTAPAPGPGGEAATVLTVEAPALEARAGRTPLLTTRWSATTVGRGTSASVRGRLAQPDPGRRVILQQRVGTRWVAQRRTRASVGRYRLPLPTATIGTRTLRLVAPVSAAQRAAGLRHAVSAPERFTVLAPGAPASSTAPKLATPLLGKATDFSYITPARARWNPCSTITYRVNPTHGPSHALADAKGAVTRIERATGLDFVYLGTTKAVPQSTNAEQHPADTHVVIAWAGAARTPLITDANVAGVGGPLGWAGTVDSAGDDVITWRRGTVVLNTSYNWLPKGFGTGTTSGKLLMHELGHVVGLGHAAGESQVMYPTLQREHPSSWQAGDTAGLRSQGAEHGCLYNKDGSTPGLARAATIGVVSQVTVDRGLDALDH